MEETNKNTKRPKKNKKLIAILVSVGVVVALALTACLLAMFLLKPAQGGTVEILSFDHQIFVKTGVSEDERTYRFKFKSSSSTVEINSESNVLDITQKLLDDELHVGTMYEVSVCMVEPSGILAGDYGKATTFTPTLILAAPQISLNAEDGKTLSWQAVEYADYYTVCYYDGSTLEKLSVTGTEFDITTILGGERQIFVTSHSNRNGLKESEKSNVVETTVIHKMNTFVSGTVSAKTKTVTIVAAEKISGIVLTDESDNSKYTIIDFTSRKIATGYEITFNIGLIYTSEGQTFLAKPLEDDYNTFVGEEIRLSNIA